MNCRPVHQTRDWPSRHEVIGQLNAQWLRLQTILAELPATRIGRNEAELTQQVSRFIHGLHDEARHQGEMYLLFKLCRARAAVQR
jgi:hypothetical protein